MKFYKNLNPSTQLNINDREVIEVWCDVFMEYSYEQVRNAIVAFSKRNLCSKHREIISNIEVPDYTIELIEPYTVIVQFEDEAYGNFPFRFFNSQEAKKISKSSKDAITIRSQSGYCMKNMLENEMLEFLHTGRSKGKIRNETSKSK